MILIIDDLSTVVDVINLEVGRKCDLIWAPTITKARELFFTHKDHISLILVDGCVGKTSAVNSDSLICEIRRSGFLRPVVATANRKNQNDILIEAGCNHRVDHISDLCPLIKKLLNLKKKRSKQVALE